MEPPALAEWHRVVRERDAAALSGLLAEEAVFHSPVVHTPQRGRARAIAYLAAALQVFGNDSFRYVREVVQGQEAALEFELELDGIVVNGIDLIRWNGDGRIVDFKVMLRPLKGIEAVHRRMAAALGAPSGP